MSGQHSDVDAVLERLITQVRQQRQRVAKLNELGDETTALIKEGIALARRIAKVVLYVLPYALGLIMYVCR